MVCFNEDMKLTRTNFWSKSIWVCVWLIMKPKKKLIATGLVTEAAWLRSWEAKSAPSPRSTSRKRFRLVENRHKETNSEKDWKYASKNNHRIYYSYLVNNCWGAKYHEVFLDEMSQIVYQNLQPLLHTGPSHNTWWVWLKQELCRYTQKHFLVC